MISYGEKLDSAFVVLRDFVVCFSKVFEAKKVKFHVFQLVAKASNKKVTHLQERRSGCCLQEIYVIVSISYL